MNNIYLNSDPLLYNGRQPDPANLNELYTQFYNLQQQKDNMQSVGIDSIGNLDKELKELDSETISELNGNSVFVDLHKALETIIQDEIINSVKGRLNLSPVVVDNVKKQLNIIRDTKSKVKERERKNINELNDYMTNYSNMSFDDYKKLKNNDCGNENG